MVFSVSIVTEEVFWLAEFKLTAVFKETSGGEDAPQTHRSEKISEIKFNTWTQQQQQEVEEENRWQVSYFTQESGETTLI